MTNLFNRRSLEATLEQKITETKKTDSAISVLMLDIDNFKKINDTYGHATGDEVLKTFADILKTNCRETDFCCRYGGEEFTIILPAADSEEAQIVAERIRQTIEKTTINYNNKNVKITTSIGVATKKSTDILATAPNEMQNLITTADNHLYEAKRQGRNQVCINQNNIKES